MKQKINFKYLTSTLLLMLLTVSALYAGKVDKIINKVQDKYRSTKTVRIEFKEKSHFKLTDTMTEIAGVLQMSGKDKYRLDSEDQVLVSNGETLWRYNKLDSQVLVDHAKKTEEDVMLNNFLYEIKDHYFGQLLEEKKVGGVKKYAIKLTPKPSEQSFFSSIKMLVKDKTWEVEEIVYVDYNGNETTYVISQIVFNPNLNTSIFTFTPPEGIQVVDLRF